MTSSYGINFQRGSGLELVVYADAAYSPRDTRRKPASGAAVMCGRAAIQWISRTQKASTLSTSEAEYVGMAEGFKEAVFLRTVWRFLLPDFEDPCIQVFEDNKGAIQKAVNPVTNSNSKHIDVRLHVLRERVEQGEFEITLGIPTCRLLDETPSERLFPLPQQLHHEYELIFTGWRLSSWIYLVILDT